jgi:hypothetical protein
LSESHVQYFATSEDAAGVVAGLLHAGDVVLVKGSRGTRTDIIADRIKEAGADALSPPYPLHTTFSVFNVTRYITFRTAGGQPDRAGLSLLMGPWLIRTLREFQIGQVIRHEGPATHRTKAGTPTMGGPAHPGVRR